MAAIGHPIVGDLKYGATTNPAHRLALHSHELKFRHPGAHIDGIPEHSSTRLAAIAPRR